ncbi:Uncharacterised protein [Klebsiella pneumoniae]|nr:Uncharacterised protein [Klebsiella pneumoniae]SYQ95253.1 Uncharacterised protein [Klebsiella pneumoniae]
MTRENNQMGMPGTHECRIMAAMLASSGITSTQNHQYNQPMV